MKYKLDENGSIVLKDGKPVVIGDDGKEYTVDALGANEKIRTANAEAKKAKKELKEATAIIATFGGIDDPAVAIQAIQTVSTMDDKHKVDMDKLTATINSTWEEKMAEKNAELVAKDKQLYQSNVTNNFALSEVVKTTVLTPDIAASFFGKHFNQDGTAKDAAGNVIYSKQQPGQPAGFEEALGVIISAYPAKDSILKSKLHSGGSGGESDNDKGTSNTDLTSTESIKAGLEKRQNN